MPRSRGCSDGAIASCSTSVTMAGSSAADVLPDERAHPLDAEGSRRRCSQRAGPCAGRARAARGAPARRAITVSGRSSSRDVGESPAHPARSLDRRADQLLQAESRSPPSAPRSARRPRRASRRPSRRAPESRTRASGSAGGESRSRRGSRRARGSAREYRAARARGRRGCDPAQRRSARSRSFTEESSLHCRSSRTSTTRSLLAPARAGCPRTRARSGRPSPRRRCARRGAGGAPASSKPAPMSSPRKSLTRVASAFGHERRDVLPEPLAHPLSGLLVTQPGRLTDRLRDHRVRGRRVHRVAAAHAGSAGRRARRRDGARARDAGGTCPRPAPAVTSTTFGPSPLAALDDQALEDRQLALAPDARGRLAEQRPRGVEREELVLHDELARFASDVEARGDERCGDVVRPRCPDPSSPRAHDRHRALDHFPHRDAPPGDRAPGRQGEARAGERLGDVAREANEERCLVRGAGPLRSEHDRHAIGQEVGPHPETYRRRVDRMRVSARLVGVLGRSSCAGGGRRRGRSGPAARSR